MLMFSRSQIYNSKLYKRQWYASNPNCIWLNHNELVTFGGPHHPCRVVRVSFDRDPRRPTAYHMALARSVGTFRNMLLTSPPIMTVKVYSLNKDMAAILGQTRLSSLFGEVDMRLTIWRFLQHCSWFQEPKCLWPNGGDNWVVLAKTVDEITGHEMLEILRSNFEDLHKSLFLP